jgi:hypothetical protein
VIDAIRAVGTEFVKIGKASSVGQRLKQMETGCPFDLHIEAVADWPDAEERRLHRHLEQSYVRGEWYRDGVRLEEVISLMRSPDGLATWVTVCEAKGWLQPVSAPKSQRKAVRLFERPLSPIERRRKEREEWWRQKASDNSLSEPAGTVSTP